MGWPSDFKGASVVNRAVRAIGIAWSQDLIGACLYHDLCDGVVEVSLITTHPRWATKPIIRQLMMVAFVDLGVAAMRARVAVDNQRARQMLLRLGFRRMGAASGRADDTKIDGRLIVYMLPAGDCRWLPQHWRPKLVTDRAHLH